MSLNFGAISRFLKQRQNEKLGKDNYKDKCQEMQDFVTNEVFRSSGTIVHKSSTFVCLRWIWQPGLLGTLKSHWVQKIWQLLAVSFPSKQSPLHFYNIAYFQDCKNYSISLGKYDLAANPWCH